MRKGADSRKLLARLAMAALLAVALASGVACGGKTTSQEAPATESGTAPEDKGESAPPSISAKALEPWTGDFDGMVERRNLRVLVVPSKTYYFVEKGQPRGAVYESFVALEDVINKKLKTRNVEFHVVFVPTSRADLIPALLAGRGDVAAAGLTITPERAAKVDFTRPMWSGVSEIVVTGPDAPALATIDDLSGKEVFVRRTSSYWEHVERLNKRLAASGKSPAKLVEVPEDLEDEDLLEMLNAGVFGITIVDAPIAKLWAQIYGGIKAREDLAVNTGGDLAWMIRKGSPKLKAELDAFIAGHGKGTTFGNTIAKRYAGSTQFIKSSTSPAEMAKFQQMVDIFKRYSDQYKVDYLLAIAQGYQESRLDQSVKSKVGAIGVMQVMPATGKELKTGDIRQLEPNIHAGVKYIRFMIDRYFANEPMTPVNKVLFSFASYNAGPARVAKLRKEAAERGLDPNIWFNNVELVAADRIGAETPTYVSSIYKYYVAYKLVSDRVVARNAAKASLKKG